MKLSERLRELRTEKGISQKECAETLCIESSKYNKWENGINCPNYDTVCMLANFFDTTTDYLLGLSQDRWKTKQQEIGALNEKQLDTINKIKELGMATKRLFATLDDYWAKLEKTIDGREI